MDTLYRQSQILLRQGIEIGREVLADWTGTAAHEVVPGGGDDRGGAAERPRDARRG